MPGSIRVNRFKENTEHELKTDVERNAKIRKALCDFIYLALLMNEVIGSSSVNILRLSSITNWAI